MNQNLQRNTVITLAALVICNFFPVLRVVLYENIYTLSPFDILMSTFEYESVNLRLENDQNGVLLGQLNLVIYSFMAVYGAFITAFIINKKAVLVRIILVLASIVILFLIKPQHVIVGEYVDFEYVTGMWVILSIYFVVIVYNLILFLLVDKEEFENSYFIVQQSPNMPEGLVIFPTFSRGVIYFSATGLLLGACMFSLHGEDLTISIVLFVLFLLALAFSIITLLTPYVLLTPRSISIFGSPAKKDKIRYKVIQSLKLSETSLNITSETGSNEVKFQKINQPSQERLIQFLEKQNELRNML